MARNKRGLDLVEDVSIMSFLKLGLTEIMQRVAEAVHYETPTPIQEQAIPLILEGVDSDQDFFTVIEKRTKQQVSREQIPGFELTGEASVKKKGNPPVKGKRPSKKDKAHAAARNRGLPD